MGVGAAEIKFRQCFCTSSIYTFVSPSCYDAKMLALFASAGENTIHGAGLVIVYLFGLIYRAIMKNTVR